MEAAMAHVPSAGVATTDLTSMATLQTSVVDQYLISLKSLAAQSRWEQIALLCENTELLVTIIYTWSEDKH
jgi:hypothetical protein